MADFGYARVSTTEQDPQLQLDALSAAGVPSENVYIDHASGTRQDRPALAQVLGRLGTGDRLTVWRLDRLGRSLPHLVTTVEELGRRGVLFRSLSDPIDTSTATGRLMLGVFASFAQFERDLIAERTTAGLAALRAAGTPLGRPTQVHPKQVELIHGLAAEGKSHRTIAHLTGLSRAQIGRVLRGEIASLDAYQPPLQEKAVMERPQLEQVMSAIRDRIPPGADALADANGQRRIDRSP